VIQASYILLIVANLAAGAIFGIIWKPNLFSLVFHGAFVLVSVGLLILHRLTMGARKRRCRNEVFE
jgi:hypothetical protein